MEFFFSVPAGVRIVCFVIVSTALLGQAAPASSLCLGFEGLLVQGEWIRIFSFPFVVASGWLGFPHLMAVLLAFVLVGSSCERRLGSVAFLSNMIWLVLLLWLSVVLFALFAVLMGFLVVSVVPTLPQVIQEVKVPDWKPCPSGWSCAIVALTLTELWGTWVGVMDHLFPAFVFPVLVPLSIAPFSVSSLLLHEIGWIAGFAFVFLQSRNLLRPLPWLRGVLSMMQSFVEAPEEELVVEDFDSLIDLALHFLPR